MTCLASLQHISQKLGFTDQSQTVNKISAQQETLVVSTAAHEQNQDVFIQEVAAAILHVPAT